MLTARRRARIEAATAQHVADLGRLRPLPFEQPETANPPLVAEQQAAWETYWENIAQPAFVGSAVAR